MKFYVMQTITFFLLRPDLVQNNPRAGKLYQQCSADKVLLLRRQLHGLQGPPRSGDGTLVSEPASGAIVRGVCVHVYVCVVSARQASALHNDNTPPAHVQKLTGERRRGRAG